MKAFFAILTAFIVLSGFSATSFAQYDHLLAEPKSSKNPYSKDFDHVIPYPSQEEPDIPKVKFLNMNPPRTMQERVDRLVHGIYIVLPPEYDHYGYEMRRYMAQIGNPAILRNYDDLQRQIKYVKNAQIILKYWKRELTKNIAEMGEEIERNPDFDSTRSKFKYNRGVVNAFFIECQDWLDHNLNFLEFLSRIDGNYGMQDGVIEFDHAEDYRTFISLYNAREKARQHIIEYAPFALMVY